MSINEYISMCVYESMSVPVETCVFRFEHIWVCFVNMCMSAWCLGVLNEHLGMCECVSLGLGVHDSL